MLSPLSSCHLIVLFNIEITGDKYVSSVLLQSSSHHVNLSSYSSSGSVFSVLSEHSQISPTTTVNLKLDTSLSFCFFLSLSLTLCPPQFSLSCFIPHLLCFLHPLIEHIYSTTSTPSLFCKLEKDNWCDKAEAYSCIVSAYAQTNYHIVNLV